MTDLFDGSPFQKPPRQKPRVMAHVIDAGDEVILFQCPHCSWESGWIHWDKSVTEAKCGIPCEICNTKGTNHAR